MISVENQLNERLQRLLPQSLQLIDDSARHAGHAGARGGKHFVVRIVASCFAGLTPLGRHRLIYDAAGDLMQGTIHALSIQAFTPDEV